MAALKQRNEELEQTLQQANLLILTLNTRIETAEKDGGARATKCIDPKKVWSQCGSPPGRTTQTVLNLRENEIAKVSRSADAVGSLCRLFDGPPQRCEPTSF